MQEALQDHLVNATKIIEDQVDAEINRLETLDDDEMEMIRKRRLDAMKRGKKQKEEYLSLGHGKYDEVSDEKGFFEQTKKSKNVVCHFYRESTFRCKIVDKHLDILARKHIETKFIKIDAEKCKFLVDRLRIKVLPTICIARDGKTVDYIVGFDDLGGSDEFPTEMLEWRLGTTQVINYSGDLANPPCDGKVQSKKGAAASKIFGNPSKKTIRDDGDDSDDDNDW